MVLWVVSGIGGASAAQSDITGTAEQRARPAITARDTSQKPPYAPGGVAGMIKIPVSSKTAAATWPRAGVPEYTFSVRSYGGPALGSDVREFDWTLQVDSRQALVSVESFRSDADIPGQPIGLFRVSVDDQQLRAFHKLLTDARLSELRPAMKGHPGYTERMYTLAEPSKGETKQLINNSDEQTNALIEPLRNRINSMLAASFKHPERAAQLAIRHSRLSSGDVFDVAITNIGVENICFTEPRWVTPAGPLQQAVLMISEFPETPPGEPAALAWKSLALKPMDAHPAKEPLVTLEPGTVWKASSVSWKGVPGKRYLAYFTYTNYAGAPMVGGVYRIRGRADSSRLVVTP
ncbi:MAG: hypothetical protein ACXWCP_16460 [Burkholderiales bacterium]